MKTRFTSVCVKHPELKGERKFSSYACIGCNREQSAIREQSEKTKAVRRAYWANNKEKRRVGIQAWRDKNNERIAAKNKEWYEAAKKTAEFQALSKERDRKTYARKKDYFAKKHKKWVALNKEKWRA